MKRNYEGKFSAGSGNPQGSAESAPAKKTGKRSKRKTWQWVLLCVLLVFLALAVAVIIFVTVTLNRINRESANNSRLSPEEWAAMNTEGTLDPDATYPVQDENSITWPSESAKTIGQEDHIVNILLIGQDRRPGEARARSDSMILVSFNKDLKKITMVSFLRDNYVPIPGGYRDDRLNAAFAIGGWELLDETLAYNFGVSIDANVEVDFTGFSSVIDVLGGVDIDLTSAEANHLNSNNGWSLSSGVNHLNGDQALAYARIRYLDSDFGRTNRQRTVLLSLIETFKNIDLTQALALVNEITPLVSTDMTNSEIIGYVTELLPLLSTSELVSMNIPGDNYYNATIRGMMVLVPDLEACREMLADALE